jgi:hypothetical protein
MMLYYRIRNFFVYGWDNLRRRCQRFIRGYAWSDVWSMYGWFMTTLEPMLIHMRNNHVGVPMEFENNPEGWNVVLDEMISCLKLMDEDNVYERLGFGDLDSYKHMTKEDYANVYNMMEENKNRFFELFSKYYFDLWD